MANCGFELKPKHLSGSYRCLVVVIVYMTGCDTCFAPALEVTREMPIADLVLVSQGLLHGCEVGIQLSRRDHYCVEKVAAMAVSASAVHECCC